MELKTQILSVHSVKDCSPDEEVEQVDAAEKAKHKEYVDKRHRARDREIKVGDQVLVKQNKTTTRPPWDPKPYLVVKVKQSKIFLERDGRSQVRNIKKCKLLKSGSLVSVVDV